MATRVPIPLVCDGTSIIGFTTEGTFVDLHNDFNLVEIVEREQGVQFGFAPASTSTTKSSATLAFSGVDSWSLRQDAQAGDGASFADFHYFMVEDQTATAWRIALYYHDQIMKLEVASAWGLSH